MLNANGRVLVYSSWANNLVPGDMNDTGDIFAYEVPSRSFLDWDEDGMDDAWEAEHFGNRFRNGREDFDGDGAWDAAEYSVGISPMDDLSVFRVAATISSTGRRSLQWSTEPGREYQLRTRETWDGAWVLAGEVLQGSGESVDVELLSGPPSSRFYQVVVKTSSARVAD